MLLTSMRMHLMSTLFLFAASQAGFALIYDSVHQAEAPVKAEHSEFIEFIEFIAEP